MLIFGFRLSHEKILALTVSGCGGIGSFRMGGYYFQPDQMKRKRNSGGSEGTSYDNALDLFVIITGGAAVGLTGWQEKNLITGSQMVKQ